MNVAFLPPGTPVDLSNCELEPIHTPGAIQPHGFTLAFDQDQRLVHVSVNFLAHLGLPASAILGKTLADFPPSLAFVAEAMRVMQGPGSLTAMPIRGEGYIARHVPSPQDCYILEFERDDGAMDFSMLQHFEKSVQSISYSGDEQTLSENLAKATRVLTGYDRVMVYRFNKEWNGEVIAEERAAGLEPFLGLQYPASDIPAQARALYQVNLSRLIVDVQYQPVALLSLLGTPALDLTHSRLRSISPMHIQYLGNMGVRATFVVSLIVDGALWGLLACHHYSEPKLLSLWQRSTIEKAAKIASLAIGAHLHLTAAAIEKAHGAKIKTLLRTGLMDTTMELDAASGPALLDLTRSQGVAIRTEMGISTYGVTPDPATLRALLDWIEEIHSDAEIFYTDALAQRFAQAEAAMNVMAGVLVIPVGRTVSAAKERAALVFFRPEFVRTVNWAGNPDKPVEGIGNILSPRRSFALWKQHKAGTSRPWEEQDIKGAAMLQKELLKSSMEYLARRRKDAEIRLASIDRMGALGQLATSVAHDFNNILQGIQSLATRAAQADSFDAANVHAKKIRTFTDRGISLIRRLLQYSRANPADYKHVDAYKVIEDAVFFATSLMPPTITIEFHAPVKRDELQFFGSYEEIIQCIVNLITNARDAMKGREGVLTVGLKSRMASANEIAARGLLPGQKYLFFEITDTGSGIAPENLPRIFDPFFSTKSKDGIGTGLGLTNVLQIVKANGGQILVESELGKGSAFKVAIPHSRADASARAKDETALAASIAEGPSLAGLQVLYVEDDADLREIHQELLKHAFAHIVSVDHGQHALDVLKAHPRGYFDVIVSDLRMPKVDGMTLYRAIRKSGDTTPFILATGELGFREQTESTIQDPAFEVIAKPFEIEELLRVTQKLVVGVSGDLRARG